MDTMKAREGFTIGTPEGRRRITKGETFAGDDPIVTSRAHLFELADEAPAAASAPLRAARAATASKKAPAKRASAAKKAAKKA